MFFKRYQHIEKFGTDETDGILDGQVHLFPKIDGTNASVFLNDDGHLAFGGRRGLVLSSQDNYKFIKYFNDNPSIKKRIVSMLKSLPKRTIIYGEWLIPVTIKNYYNAAWRRFYIFDVVTYPDDLSLDDLKDDVKTRRLETYLPYDVYSRLCEEYDLDYIPLLKSLKNPKIEEIERLLDETKFLIADKDSLGEGIVIKNYSYKNKYGRQTWAKLLTADFRNKKIKMRTDYHEDKQEFLWEHKLVVRYANPEFVSKEVFKYKDMNPDNFENDKFVMKNFPALSKYIFEEFLRDNIILAVNEYKCLEINFTTLRKLLEKEIKDYVLSN